MILKHKRQPQKVDYSCVVGYLVVLMTMMMMVLLQHQDDIKVDMGIHTMELDLSCLFGSMKEDPRSSPEPPGKAQSHLHSHVLLFLTQFCVLRDVADEVAPVCCRPHCYQTKALAGLAAVS